MVQWFFNNGYIVKIVVFSYISKASNRKIRLHLFGKLFFFYFNINFYFNFITLTDKYCAVLTIKYCVSLILCCHHFNFNSFCIFLQKVTFDLFLNQLDDTHPHNWHWFFSLSSAKLAEEKLQYAAYNCIAIDTDVSPWDDWFLAAPFQFLSQTTNNACPYLCLCLVSSGYCSIGACLDTLPPPKSFGISTFLAVIACWLFPTFHIIPLGFFQILSSFIWIDFSLSLSLFCCWLPLSSCQLLNGRQFESVLSSFFFFLILESFCLFIIYFSFPNTHRCIKIFFSFFLS